MIAIPNMSKPKGCGVCEIWSLCHHPKVDDGLEERVMPDCPLIEIEEWNSFSNGKMYALKGTFQKILDDEAIDIAQDIMNGCKELKERVDKGIVRCGECKHYNDDICDHPRCEVGDILITEPTDFCSYGERRADE